MRNRRWMYALLTGLALAGAARSVLAQNETKDKEPAKEPAKEATREGASSKETAKDKRYLFEMRNKPWAGVF